MDAGYIIPERKLVNSGICDLKITKSIRIFGGNHMKLKDSDMLAQVFEDSLDPIIIEDLNGIVIEMNREAESAYGFSREELIGSSIKRIVPEDNHQQAEALLSKCIKGERVRNVESRRRNKKGSVLPVLLTLSLLKSGDGSPAAIASISKNIIKQKEIENELKEITGLFESILNNVPVCVHTTDQNGIITRSMGSGLLKAGFSDGSLKGKSIFTVLPKSSDELGLAFSGESVTLLETGEYDEKLFVFQYTLFPGLPDGGIVAIGLDVTELRDLQRRVISISEEERESISRELHDELGQLLTGIAYLVKALEEKVSDNLNVDISDIRMIAELIRNALDRTRSISSGLSMQQIHHDFTISIEELLAEMERLYSVNFNLKRTGEVMIEDPSVATHLYYIVKEAVHNAVKHGSERDVSIDIDAGDELIRIEVRNKGDFLFRNREKAGGLGLRIMKYRADIIGAKFESIIDQHDFCIQVEKQFR